MNRSFTCSLLAAAAALAARAPASPAPAPVPAWAAAAFEGRCAPGSDGSVRLGFPGVTLHLRFHGASLSLRARAAKDGNCFDVSVDGAAPFKLRLQEGEQTYAVADRLANGDHLVALTRCNESAEGTCAVLAFGVGDEGAILPPPPLPARRLLFIGDSVTCGAVAGWKPGDNIRDESVEARQDRNNARFSYGMVLARRFGAQCHLVSYGGQGIIRDWSGNRGSNTAPKFYELALPDDPAALWDPALYVPDAVGIQLGTNDCASGIPDQNEFVNAYVELIRKVRRDAPNALIFLMDSPMLYDDPAGPRRSVLHAYLVGVVKRIGSPRVVLAPLAHVDGVPGNSHPSGPDHEAMATEIEPILRQGLGW